VYREWREPCDWTWKPAPTSLRWPLSNSALLRPLRSRMTCKNAGSHSGKRVIADKDEAAGSSPARPTEMASDQQKRWSGRLSSPGRLGCIPIRNEVFGSASLPLRATWLTSAFGRPLCLSRVMRSAAHRSENALLCLPSAAVESRHRRSRQPQPMAAIACSV
jgi:hypothetical protein